MAVIGVIGGSGLDKPDILKNMKTLSVDTPYGKPSSPLLKGRIGNHDVIILSRHGQSHEFSPTQVNNRANIHALKSVEVSYILATTACGSLRTDIRRGDMVLLDQFIDFTRLRKNTFYESFESGLHHTAMSSPFDGTLREILYNTANSIGISIHQTGCVITIEGPRFSTIAESKMFRSWGADVINMSTAPEAALANEAGIPYAAVAMATDYDSWKTDEPAVTWEEVLRVFNANADKVKKLIVKTIENLEV